MEQARFWMWAKPKPELNPRAAAMNSYGDSWEEQAFAEDAAGALGGCVWPPRSYSCSFCRRDFRSAQALGGHMNVHRRDRARLKQSPTPTAADVVPQNHALNPCTSFDAPYSSQICTFLYNNPNPNPEFSDVGPFVPPLARVIRVSPPPPPLEKAHTVERISSTLGFFSPNVEKIEKNPPSWSSFLSEKRDRGSDNSVKSGEKKSAAAADLESRVEREDCVTEDLSMSLNLVVCKRQATNTSSDEEVASCKRRRIEANSLSFLAKLSTAVDRCLPQSEVLKLCSADSGDELDLELRLGEAPKVK